MTDYGQYLRGQREVSNKVMTDLILQAAKEAYSEQQREAAEARRRAVCGSCGHHYSFHRRGRSGKGSCRAVSTMDQDNGIDDWDLATDPCMCEGWDPEFGQKILLGTVLPKLELMA